MGYYVKKNADDKSNVSIEYQYFEDARDHCPEGYSVFNSYGKCLYTRIDPENLPVINNDLNMTKEETLPVNYEHDKYKYIWDQLKLNIKERLDALHEIEDESLVKRHEHLVEERELLRITMMMKSLEK